MPKVYWIGGSPCAGKTTVAALLRQEHELEVYHLDRHIESYLDRAQTDQHPHLNYYKKVGLKGFLVLAPEEQLRRVLGMCMECLPFVLEDIEAFSADSLVLVEGSLLRPVDIVRLAPEHQAFWLVPTEKFLLQAYPRRGTWVQEVLRSQFPEDKRLDIFDNWMRRDMLHAHWTAEQALEVGIPVLWVDGTQSLQAIAAHIETQFGFEPYFALAPDEL